MSDFCSPCPIRVSIRANSKLVSSSALASQSAREPNVVIYDEVKACDMIRCEDRMNRPVDLDSNFTDDNGSYITSPPALVPDVSPSHYQNIMVEQMNYGSSLNHIGCFSRSHPSIPASVCHSIHKSDESDLTSPFPHSATFQLS